MSDGEMSHQGAVRRAPEEFAASFRPLLPGESAGKADGERAQRSIDLGRFLENAPTGEGFGGSIAYCCGREERSPQI